MKKTICIFILSVKLLCTYGQEVDKSVKLEDLAVPNSPAFIITDISPSLIETPNTPKAFVLGVAQSYQQSSDGFPQNYSAEFAPYWWLRPANRNVYSLVGLKNSIGEGRKSTEEFKSNPFSGLKFTSFSLAFLNKDLIPDSMKESQKVFSFGIRTNVIKLHLKGHTEKLVKKINDWHTKAQIELEGGEQEIMSRMSESDTAGRRKVAAKLFSLKSKQTTAIVSEINDLINQKPIFSFDIAGAYAIYGIQDSIWRTGRISAWATVSSYIPLALGGEDGDHVNTNYFNLNFSVRYMQDNYHRNSKGLIESNSSVDLGGKAALEFNKFSIGIESLYRFNNGVSNSQNRTLGILNYKIKDNLYLNGAFGKNFDTPNKLISMFGINWGFGNERVSQP